jgi:hypothetical protein
MLDAGAQSGFCGAGVFAYDVDVFTGAAACGDLLGLLFGQDLAEGHAVGALETLNLAFSFPEAAAEEKWGEHDGNDVSHGWPAAGGGSGGDDAMPVDGDSSFSFIGREASRAWRCVG